MLRRFSPSLSPWVFLLALTGVACGSEEDSPGKISAQDPVDYPITEQRYTTLQQLWAPLDPPPSTNDARVAKEFSITDLPRYEELGLGVEFVSGESWTEKDDLAPDWQSHVPSGRRSLTFFWHSTDPQVVDEESPIRLAGVTGMPVGSAYRSQEHLSTQAFESQVRTVRSIMEDLRRPLDFAIVTGDLADGGQRNELGWVLDILSGGVIDPDTGVNDDPVPGPGNDFNDPYFSLGINVPWYALVGNHEVLYSGIAEANESVQAAAVGSEVFQGLEYFTGIAPGDGIRGGFRDGSTVWSEVRTEGPTPADTQRYIPGLQEVLQLFHDQPGEPPGHGLSAEDVAASRGYFTFYPVTGLPLRVISLNTLSVARASSDGALDQAQWAWLEAELADADAKNELVFIASHHKASEIKLGDFKGADLSKLLASYDNVLLHFTGHGHSSTSELILPAEAAADGKPGYWEVMTPSTIDFPLQTRFWELVDEGGGYISIYATLLDHNAPEGSLGHQARQLAAGHGWFQSRNQRQTFDADRAHRNFILRYKLPARLADVIASAPGEASIASEDTLLAY